MNTTTPIVTAEDGSIEFVKTKLIQQIRRMPMLEKRWDAMTVDQRKDVLTEVLSTSDQPSETFLTDTIYRKCGEWNISLINHNDSPAASAKRERRRNRRKTMVNENGETVAKEPVVRGGATTLILKDQNDKIVRFKIRKKGGPKYETTSELVTMVKINGQEVPMVFNPAEGSKSNRTGFRFTKAGSETSEWFILDDEAAHKLFSEADDLEFQFTVVEPGTPAPAAEGDADAKPKRKSKKQRAAEKAAAENTDELPAAPEEEGDAQTDEEPEVAIEDLDNEPSDPDFE